jgi:hypothetical protein
MIWLGPSGFGAAGKEAQCSRSTSIKPFTSSAGCSFIFRPPDTGNKSDAWRRSGVAFVRWPLPALPAFAGDSFARLRFKAAIRSITGGGALTARGLMATPYHLGLDQLSQCLLVTKKLRHS